MCAWQMPVAVCRGCVAQTPDNTPAADAHASSVHPLVKHCGTPGRDSHATRATDCVLWWRDRGTRTCCTQYINTKQRYASSVRTVNEAISCSKRFLSNRAPPPHRRWNGSMSAPSRRFLPQNFGVCVIKRRKVDYVGGRYGRFTGFCHPPIETPLEIQRSTNQASVWLVSLCIYC